MAIKAVLQRMTPLDMVIVLAMLTLTGAGFFLSGTSTPGRQVVAEQDGSILFTAPLDKDRTVSLSGPLGETTLEIKKGKACITDSPCPNKVCMGMGTIEHAHDLIACVPNHIVVRIEGQGKKEEKGYDLLSR